MGNILQRWRFINLPLGHVSCRSKCRPNQFWRFAVYWIQTNRQAPKRSTEVLTRDETSESIVRKLFCPFLKLKIVIFFRVLGCLYGIVLLWVTLYTRMKNYWSKTTFFYLAVCWSIEAWILILCCQSEQEIQSKSGKKILWFQLMLNIRKYQPWWLFYSWIPFTIHYNLDKKIILKISINLSRIVTTFWIFCKSNFGIYKHNFVIENIQRI